MADTLGTAEGSKSAISTAYAKINAVSSQISSSIDGQMFSTFSSIFFSSIVYNIIGIIIVFWLIYRMKNGGFSKDDIFKGGIWLIVLLFIYGVLSDFKAYSEFKSWFMIPAHIVKAMITSFAGTSNMGDILANTFSIPYDMYFSSREYGMTADQKFHKEWYGRVINFKPMMSYLAIAAWWLVIGAYFIIIVMIMIMQIGALFACGLFSCFAPILMMLLIVPQTRPYFFSWLKNLISISLYVPMSALPLLVIQKINDSIKLTAPNLWNNTTFYFFMSIIALFIAFYIMQKIPEWINTVMGTQDSGNGYSAATAQSIIGGAFSLGMKGKDMATSTIGSAMRAPASFADGISAMKMGRGGSGGGIASGGGGSGGGGGSSGGGKVSNGFKATGKFVDTAGSVGTKAGNAMMRGGSAMMSNPFTAPIGAALMATGAATTAVGVGAKVAGKTVKAAGHGIRMAEKGASAINRMRKK